MKPLVLYHADCLDGFVAAWLLHRLYGEGNADFLAVRYGDPLPQEVAGRPLTWIVDFSYQREDLLRLKSLGQPVIVVDHHKTAQADLDGLDFCVFDLNESGASLLLKLLWSVGGGPDAGVPITAAVQEVLRSIPAIDVEDHMLRIVEYVRDRDLWLHQLGNAKAIQTYLEIQPLDFKHWDNVVAPRFSDLDSLIETATAMYAYKLACVQRSASKAGLTNLDGHIVPCVNVSAQMKDDVGEILAKDAPFAVLWYGDSGGRFLVSLRSNQETGMDVSAIAEKFGGGGHRNAAGFVSNAPPIALKRAKPKKD